VIAAFAAVALAAASPAPPPPPHDPVVARVGARVITASELEAAAARRLIEVKTREHDLQRRALDEIVEAELLRQEAARRGVTVDALVAAEVTAKTVPIGAWDVEAYRSAHEAELKGKSDAEAQDEAARQLREARVAQRRFGFLAELRARVPTTTSLPPPRVPIETGDGPSRGPADAPVTIVEFSEFQCPFCRRVAPTVRELEERYKGRVRLVFRHFPLNRHKDAPKAAEAAECARESGRFWEMHDRLFANAEKLSVSDLKEHARAIGLDGGAFDACLDSGRQEPRWRRDLADAQSYGATGTPMFFINGRLVSGAQPFAVFARVIDEELAAAGK
jgi:predicted DsbA family dithiol-disulfide isomerase